MSAPTPIPVSSIQDGDALNQYDAAIVISDTLTPQSLGGLSSVLTDHQVIDARVGKEPILLAAAQVPGQRLLHAPTGPLNRYYDDVRRCYDAGREAAKLALAAGVSKPLLMVSLEHQGEQYQNAIEVAYLGFAQGLWQPLEARESLGEEALETINSVGMVGLTEAECDYIYAIELGKRLARDLCGTEPERMAPPKFADYCVEAFSDTCVDVSVIEDDHQLRQDYPLLYGVARASVNVKRHQPRVVRLCYEGEGLVQKSLFLAGKGITFDTGGADLKVGGHMAGMSRDKGGAAAVAGFMLSLAKLQPKNIKVVAELGVVRNSIGEEAFVPDEIITSHAGVRVRVGNTDAEGRMVLADVMSHLRELALQQPQETKPEVYSVATLTGHAAIALGPYTGYVQNGVAQQRMLANGFIKKGALWGDCGELSASRREDYDFIKARTKADDVLSSNNAPSVSTMRGHQFPMAFLNIASGIDQHDENSDFPIAYTHVDIAGSGVENSDWQHGKPTAAPVAAMVATYIDKPQ